MYVVRLILGLFLSFLTTVDARFVQRRGGIQCILHRMTGVFLVRRIVARQQRLGRIQPIAHRDTEAIQLLVRHRVMRMTPLLELLLVPIQFVAVLTVLAVLVSQRGANHREEETPSEQTPHANAIGDGLHDEQGIRQGIGRRFRQRQILRDPAIGHEDTSVLKRPSGWLRETHDAVGHHRRVAIDIGHIHPQGGQFRRQRRQVGTGSVTQIHRGGFHFWNRIILHVIIDLQSFSRFYQQSCLRFHI